MKCGLPYRGLLVLLALAVAAPAGAQDALGESVPAFEPTSTFFESVEVSLVNVEVFVTDRDGEPLAGLRAEDFEILVDGEPRELTNFFAAAGVRGDADAVADAVADAPSSPASRPSEAPGEPEPLPPEQRLNLVLFVDNENLAPTSRNRVIRAVEEQLFRHLRPDDRVTLVSYDGSVTMRRFPTADPVELAAALEEVARGSASGVHSDLDRIQILRLLQQRDLEGDAEDLAQLAVGAGAVQDTQDWTSVRSAIYSYAQGQYDSIQRTVGTLEQFVGGLSGLTGRKALVYVSDGLSLHPGEPLFRAYNGKATSSHRPDVELVPQGDIRQYDATPLFERLGREANAGRVTFYTILAAGRSSQTLTPAERGAFVDMGGSPSTLGQVWNEGLDALERANARGSLQILADATGGRATLAASDFDDAIRDLQRDFDTYYSLAFRAVTPRDEDREIEVRVKVPGADVRHRESFRRRSPDQEMESSTRAALVFRQGENPLDLRVEFGDSRAAKKGRYLLPVIVKFPISNLVLVPGESFHEGKVSIYVAARDASGHLSAVRKMPAPVRVPNEEILTAMGQVAGYRMTLLLEPGEHQVAVAVRDELADRRSTAVQNVDAARLLPPADAGP